MATFTVGTLNDVSGCTYTCTITYTATRSGANAVVSGVSATITCTSTYQTQNRIAVTLTIGGTTVSSNITILNSGGDGYPTTRTVNLSGRTFSNPAATFSMSAIFRSTGYSTSWDNNVAQVSNSTTVNIGAQSWTVSYNSNGATSGSAPSAQSKTYGSNLTLRTNTGNLAKTGYILSGWNTNASGTGTHYALGGTYSTNAAVTLYAEWTLDTESYKFCIMWVWNGSTWKKAIPWMWNGSMWKSINSHIWK